jgi:hypothetical protein
VTPDRPPVQDTPPAPSFAANGNGGEPKDSPKADPPKSSAPKPRRKPQAQQLQGKLEDFFAGIALFLMAAGDEHCATIMADRAKPLAEAWARLAATNDRVRTILERFTSGSAYAEVVTVTLATALPIAAHHVPAVRDQVAAFPFSFGIPTPPPPSGPTPPSSGANGTPAT